MTTTGPTGGPPGLSRVLGGPILDPGVKALVTAGFHPYTDFAGFGPTEAAMLRSFSSTIDVVADGIAAGTSRHLAEQFAREGIEAGVDGDAIAEWLVAGGLGPFDEDLAARVREGAHRAGGPAFPGVGAPLPAQMVVAAMARLQGEALLSLGALGGLSDTVAISGLGGIWMCGLILQLGIMLEPAFAAPVAGPCDLEAGGPAWAHGHPFAPMAGLGPREGRLIGESAAWLAPAGPGLLSLVYAHLCGRPESAGYFTACRGLFEPAPGELGTWFAQVSGHLRGVAEPPGRRVPPQLTTALAAWAAMRMMTALNACPTADGGPGQLGNPGAFARLARAWVGALTLQLGLLILP